MALYYMGASWHPLFYFTIKKKKLALFFYNKKNRAACWHKNKFLLIMGALIWEGYGTKCVVHLLIIIELF
jgi:hypothetical protein